MKSRFELVLALATLVPALVGGCRGELARLDADPEVRALDARVGEAAPPMARLAISPIEVAYKPVSDLKQDPTHYPMTVDVAALRAGLIAAIAAHTGFSAPTPIAAPDLASVFALAEKARANVLVRPILRRLDCRFRGRNWRWVPNLALFLGFWAPALWVPDEDYALDGDLELDYYSVASERLLFQKHVVIDEVFPLDQFERGMSWTGIATDPGNLEPENWATISGSLAPLLLRAAEKGAVIDIAGPLRAHLASDEFAAKDATVYSLVFGTSHTAHGLPAPEGASADAARVAALLHQAARVPERNIRLLVDEKATRDAVERAFADLRARARPGDTVLVYWSGLGVALGGDAGGEPERRLVPYDASPAALTTTTIPLERLRALVTALPARRAIVVIDASFGPGRPGTRSLPGAPGPDGRGDADLRRWTERGEGTDLTLFVAASPGEDAIDFDGAGRGLFSFLYEEGAAGAADADRDGTVSMGELQAYVEREVSAQAGLGRTPQHPRLYRAGRRAAPQSEDARGPWLPGADLQPARPRG